MCSGRSAGELARRRASQGELRQPFSAAPLVEEDDVPHVLHAFSFFKRSLAAFNLTNT